MYVIIIRECRRISKGDYTALATDITRFIEDVALAGHVAQASATTGLTARCFGWSTAYRPKNAFARPPPVV